MHGVFRGTVRQLAGSIFISAGSNFLPPTHPPRTHAPTGLVLLRRRVPGRPSILSRRVANVPLQPTGLGMGQRSEPMTLEAHGLPRFPVLVGRTMETVAEDACLVIFAGLSSSKRRTSDSNFSHCNAGRSPPCNAEVAHFRPFRRTWIHCSDLLLHRTAQGVSPACREVAASSR